MRRPATSFLSVTPPEVMGLLSKLCFDTADNTKSCKRMRASQLTITL